MTYSLEDFCAEASQALKSDQSKSGCEAVRAAMQHLLENEDFVARYLGPDSGGMSDEIYRDADTGFVLLTHNFTRGGIRKPHDHGPSFAVYGQAHNYTDQTIWRRIDDGTEDGYAELEVADTFRQDPGHVALIDIGEIHSIAYPDNSRILRLLGTDLEQVVQARYDEKTNKVRFTKAMPAGAETQPARA